MLFKKYKSVPANTTLDAPDWEKLSVSKGEIIEWIIVTPLECANLLQFWVDYHGVQILPFTTGERIYGFTTSTPIRESLEIDTPPYELDIKAINTDTVKAHEYNLYVNVMPSKPVKPIEEGIEGLWERLKGWVGGE